MLQTQTGASPGNVVLAQSVSPQMPKAAISSEIKPKGGGCQAPGVTIRFARGQTIFAQGDRSMHVYKVVEGAVRVSRILSDGHRQILDIHLPGSTFGLEFTDSYTATAEAIGDAVVRRSSRTGDQGGAPREQAREMMLLLSQALNATYDHLTMLGHQGAKQRVASFLIQLAGKESVQVKRVVDIPVNRQDMADYLGLTIETTCRTLSDLKASRIISTPDRRQFVIHNRERLEAIADGEC